MAFTFPTRTPVRLFFPTVHVHDGTFEATASFDHALYYQRAMAADGDHVAHLPVHKTYEGLVELGQPMVRRTLDARLANQDTFI